jgi:hypothetical protein
LEELAKMEDRFRENGAVKDMESMFDDIKEEGTQTKLMGTDKDIVFRDRQPHEAHPPRKPAAPKMPPRQRRLQTCGLRQRFRQRLSGSDSGSGSGSDSGSDSCNGPIRAQSPA